MLKGISGVLDNTEEWVSELEDRVLENTKLNRQKRFLKMGTV